MYGSSTEDPCNNDLSLSVRPSHYLPTVELLWTTISFCFSVVQSIKQVYALRFLVGILESPFADGVITLMGNWYTSRELAKGIAIFYSASYAASMFTGYLQAGTYEGLDGHLGIPGWPWLLTFSGIIIISLSASIWGLRVILDSPYTTRARWLPEESKQFIIDRMEKIDRRAPAPLFWAKSGKFSLTGRFHCLVTQPLNYFAVWLKSLNKFSVYQINLFPTAGQVLGFATTLAYAWVSDGIGGKIWQILIVPASRQVLVLRPQFLATSSVPILGVFGLSFMHWMNEICHADAEERAIMIGVAQTLGQAFIAWVLVVILNVGKYAPQLKVGSMIMSVLSVGELTMMFVIKWFVDRYRKRDVAAETAIKVGKIGDDTQPITLEK